MIHLGQFSGAPLWGILHTGDRALGEEAAELRNDRDLLLIILAPHTWVLATGAWGRGEKRESVGSKVPPGCGSQGPW